MITALDATNAPKKVPQSMSTIESANGHDLSVARLVRSYVAYEKNPNKPPKRSAVAIVPFVAAGYVAKKVSPTRKRA